MSKNWTQKHITDDDIDEYVDHRLTEQEEISFDEHVAECNACAEKVRTARQMMFLWDNWTAKTHGQAYQAYVEQQRARVLSALETAESEAAAPTASRLHTWRKLGGIARGAVKVVLDIPKVGTKILLEGVEAVLQPEPHLEFAYVRAARTRGAVRVHGGPVRTRGAVKDTDMEERIVEDKSGTSITVAEGSISVRVRGLQHGQQPPIVLLVPDAMGEKPITKEPQLEMQTGDYLATFENVPHGKFTLLLEP